LTNLQIISLTIAFVGISLLFKNTSFSALIEDKAFQHRLFGASAIIFLIWVLRVGIVDGLSVHFLWLTSLALMVGFRLSIITAAFLMLGSTIVGQETFGMFGVNILIGVVLPIAISYAVLMLSFHKMERHVFVYIFICAFFASGLAIAIKMLLQGLYYYIDLDYSWYSVRDNFLKVIPLVVFPEALFNGMIMTLLVIYRPSWVYTFHDKFYIDGK